MSKYLSLIRVKHYIKNFLIFLPLFFSRNILNKDYFFTTMIAFIAFSSLASVVYIINDLKDYEFDKKHPLKKKRSLASGEVSKKKAVVCALFLITTTTLLTIFFLPIDYKIYLVLFAYFVINIFYSFGLKNIPLLDVTILMLGFLLRLFFGALINDIAISNWLYLTVMSMAFYISFGKRKTEITNGGFKTRVVLKYYKEDFLNRFMSIFIGLTIVFYSLWCIDIQNLLWTNYLIWTIPLLLIIVMKYSLNLEVTKDGDAVEILIKDKILISLIGIYLIALLVILYR